MKLFKKLFARIINAAIKSINTTKTIAMAIISNFMYAACYYQYIYYYCLCMLYFMLLFFVY